MSSVFMLILIFFAVYGALQIIAKTVFGLKKEKNDAVFVHRVIGVLNCGETVEGMIRSVVWEDIREDLIVIDMGSTDDTGEILGKLEKDYDFIKVMNIEEYKGYIEKYHV